MTRSVIPIWDYPEIEWRYLAEQNQRHKPWTDLEMDRAWAMYRELPVWVVEADLERPS